MTGFLERFLDRTYAEPADKAKHTRHHTLGSRISRNARRVEDHRKKIFHLRRDFQDLQAAGNRIADLEQQVDRLTRCLFANGVIEQADLDATLPSSSVQDTPSGSTEAR